MKIFGIEKERRAEVIVLNGFSAHGDQSDLLNFAQSVRDKGPLRQISLVHGEDSARAVLKEKLLDLGFPTVHTPMPGDTVRF
ncbi:MAG: MBL fold metallo-hydrolase RNA specificity domain-containing protein [Polyangiales bacterium]